jgi:hypothetical protein
MRASAASARLCPTALGCVQVAAGASAPIMFAKNVERCSVPTKYKCAMTGCRRAQKTNLYMGQSNRGLGAICLIICGREHHEAELAAFYKRHISPCQPNFEAA